MPIPPVAAEQAASSAVEKVTSTFVKAATAPIFGSETIEVWDPEREEFVPYARVKKRNLNAVGVAVLGLLGLGTLGVAQRAARTGTISVENEYEFKVTAPKEGDTLDPFGVARGKTRTVWAETPTYLSPIVGETVVATGRTRRRPRVQVAEKVQGYNPVVGRLLG